MNLDSIIRYRDMYQESSDTTQCELVLEAYNPVAQANILTKNTFSFYNKENRRINVLKGGVYENVANFKWCFDDTPSRTFWMKLSSFLWLYKKGEFHDISSKTFINKYMIPVKEKIGKFNDLISLASLDELNKYFNTRLSAEEESVFFGWLAKTIYSIRLYTADNNIMGGYVSISDPDRVPLPILRKIVSTNGKRTDDILRGNRINDTRLACFLADRYYTYGFRANKRKLAQYLDIEKMAKNLFPANRKTFIDSYINA